MGLAFLLFVKKFLLLFTAEIGQLIKMVSWPICNTLKSAISNVASRFQ